jgi:hypothetical protein
MWDLWWTKRHWGRFSQSISVSLASHSIDFSIIKIIWGWHNKPTSDHSAEWTQLDSTPHYTNVVPCSSIFLGKWCSSFAGGFDGKMNVQSGCALNT